MVIFTESPKSAGPDYCFKFFEVAQIVLTIPHSNAAIEQLLSLVNKNKNDDSGTTKLDVQGSLSSILPTKLQ